MRDRAGWARSSTRRPAPAWCCGHSRSIRPEATAFVTTTRECPERSCCTHARRNPFDRGAAPSWKKRQLLPRRATSAALARQPAERLVELLVRDRQRRSRRDQTSVAGRNDDHAVLLGSLCVAHAGAEQTGAAPALLLEPAPGDADAFEQPRHFVEHDE